ncbi:MAG: hypothetical protein ABI533_04240 [Betaproteobacteria bacterium]
MEPAERARTYAALAESTRRWVVVMDGKAGFLFTVNGALLTFMWIGARLTDVAPAAQWLAVGASLGSLLALLAALWVVIPRRTFALSGTQHGEYRPISFYGYVATHYGAREFRRFEQDAAAFDDADFSRESLAEHFMVSRIVRNKTAWVVISGALTFASMALAGAALLVKTLVR